MVNHSSIVAAKDGGNESIQSNNILPGHSSKNVNMQRNVFVHNKMSFEFFCNRDVYLQQQRNLKSMLFSLMLHDKV